MSVPLVILAQSLMLKLMDPPKKWQTVFGVINWFILHRCFEYLSVAFILLDIDAIIKTWSHMYFYNHIMTIFFIILPLILTRKNPIEDGENAKSLNGKRLE